MSKKIKKNATGYSENGYFLTQTINHFGTNISINNPTMTKVSADYPQYHNNKVETL
jgi:hypothetical protein